MNAEDGILVVSANAIKNELVLMSGDVITGTNFVILPMNPDGTYKGYQIFSWAK